MAPKGGTFIFLLGIVACAVLAIPPDRRPENKRDFEDMANKLMRKCKTKGYPMPGRMQLNTFFNNSDLPMADRNPQQFGSLLSTLLHVLNSVSPDGDQMTNKTWNFSNLPKMLELMRNSSVASACYMQAFVAPVFWETLTTQSENNMTSDEYDTLLSAAKHALKNMPFTRINLPPHVGRRQKLKKMMEMLTNVSDAMSKDQRIQVVRWLKEQVTQKYFNCTMRPPSDPRSMLMKSCKPSLEWLNLEALTMMGPYVSRLSPGDVDSVPKEQLCEFFHSAKFASAMSMTSKINPSLGKKFLQRFQECFSGNQEFAENVDKLGILACHYSTAPDFTSDISRKLLSELQDCDDFGNPKITQLKKRLVKSVMSNINSTEALRELGTMVAFLSRRQLSGIPNKTLKEFLKTLGNTVQWTKGQQRTLVQKLLYNKSEVSAEDLMDLQSVAGGLPSRVLKLIRNIRTDKESLKNMSMWMSKGQLMAVMQRLLGQMAPSELVQKLSGRLLRRLSLNKLDKADILSFTSLNKVGDERWSVAQAAFVAKQMHDRKKLHWKLHSVLQGVTCKMIDNVVDNDVQDMAQAITETPQWLSKVQAGCAARKLFAMKNKERADYFKTITEEEMINIPTHLLLHLPPMKVRDLPDSVCPAFLDKMEEANLSSLPRRSPSRPALSWRALLCLAEGPDLSGLMVEDVSRLGLLLCEIQPFQLLLMAPDVLNFSLQQMASCQHIPQRHRGDIIQLVTQTFGDPSYWSAETMEALGPFLLLDDNATSALPNKPWMTDVLYSLKSGGNYNSKALGKKIFDLTTATSNAASTHNTDKELTVELIEELGMDNVYWTHTQLAQMSDETFLTTLETLGAVCDYGPDQLTVLSEKAIEVLGPVSQMNESVVMQMGCITRGFSNADLEKLPFSLDALEEIATCGWIESQMEPVWRGVAVYNNLTAQQLEAADMVALSQFICGLNSSEFGQLNMNAFKDAVGSMEGVQCSSKGAQQLKNLAVSAFGNPNTWTEAQVSELGNIIAGLNSTELASLDSAVFSFISESCIPLIPHFAVLSVAQLEALGPDNAAMVTSKQRASLNDDQLAALERAVTGSPDQTQRNSLSGTPSLNVEGISAFMKPFLLLLMGFLLL